MPTPAMDHPDAPLVFISYSHRDQKWAEALLEQLKPLQRERLLDCWSDADITPGDAWRTAIERALNRAAVAVLMVSPAFLASDFIAGNELPRLLDAARAGTLRVLWVPLSASVYAHTPIGTYQAVCDPTRPIDTLSKAKRNQALVEIANEVLAAVERAGSGVRADQETSRARHADGALPYDSAAAVAIRPTLMIVYRREGWYLQNTGRGPSLNTIVAQKIVTGPSRGTWVNPVRVPTLAAGQEMLLTWLDHENDTGLGATYEDEDGRLFTSLTGNDLTRVVRQRQLPTFDEEMIRRHWQVRIGSPQPIGTA